MVILLFGFKFTTMIGCLSNSRDNKANSFKIKGTKHYKEYSDIFDFIYLL